ncbi:type I secretion C-terminal target domain-containing protein [Aquicoccus sp. SCR17]|nr:type I secretion C-terminal target domain-containing protein [Carideicomes alvinocaridis]
MTDLTYEEVFDIDIADATKKAKAENILSQMEGTPEGQELFSRIKEDSGTVKLENNESLGNSYNTDTRTINISWDELAETRVKEWDGDYKVPSDARAITHEVGHAAEAHRDPDHAEKGEPTIEYLTNEYMNKYYSEERIFGDDQALFNQTPGTVPHHTDLNENPNYKMKGWGGETMLDLLYDSGSNAWYHDIADWLFGSEGDKIHEMFQKYEEIKTDELEVPERGADTNLESVEDALDDAESSSSPLILDLDDSGTIDLSSLASSDIFWDIDEDGFRERAGWVDANDGLLAIDANADGVINHNGELFGNTNTDGFTILAGYDTNDDGQIDSQDAVWDDLIVWQDANEDAYSQDSELHSVSDFNIVSFDLSASTVSQTNEGHDVSHTSTFVVDDGLSGPEVRIVHDIWFQYDDFYSVYNNSYALAPEALILEVDLRGYGAIPDLHIAMSLDKSETGNLLGLVSDLEVASFANLFDETNDLRTDIRDIMFRWAGVDDTPPTSRGVNVDAQELEFLEAMMGQPFVQSGMGGSSNPGPYAATKVDEAWSIAYNNIYARLTAQSAGGELFTGDFYYDIAGDEFSGITGLDATKLAALEAEATALSTTGEKDVFWGNVVRMIEFSVGTTNLPGGDQTDLDDAITASDASLDLQDILDGLDYVEPSGTTYNGTSGDDTLTAGSDFDTLNGNDGNDTLEGGDGNDTINGGDGDDQLYGEDGSDYLKGGAGDDSYYYEIGDTGWDIIRETGTGTGHFDEIVFGAGIDSGDVTLTRYNNSGLFIDIDTGSQTGQIFIENQFTNVGGSGHVEQLRYDDSSTFDLDDRNWTTYGTSGDDTLFGIYNGHGGWNNDTIYGGAGDDDINGGSGTDSGAGDDTLYGEDGNDVISGGQGTDTIYGGAGDDDLSGGNGDDEIHAGTGNDRIDGGGGADDFYYTSGHLTLVQTNSTDTIYLDAAWDTVTPDYYKIDNDLQITFDLDNTITIKGMFGTYGLNSMVYDDTTTVDLTSISYVSQGTSGNDDIDGTGGDDVIYGFAGDDELGKTVYGNGNDTLFGGTGDDILKGGNNNDYLDGGAGDDEMLGGSGDDHFYYVSGHDIAEAGGGDDILEIDGSWDYEDLTLGRYTADLDDLVISFGSGAVNTITIDEMFNGSVMETLRLNDGTGDIDLQSIGYTAYGTSGADTLDGFNNSSFNGGNTPDTIYGYEGADTIDGKNGDDLLYGGDDADDISGSDGEDILYGDAGNDTLNGGNEDDILYGGAGNDVLYGGRDSDLYVYESGLDEIYESHNQEDTIWITDGVVIDEISIADTDDNDTTITINSGTDEIYIDRQESGYNKYHIENLRFDDGFETDELENYDSWMWGTTGNDSTTGNSNDNVIIGDDGDDDIDAGAGADDVHGGAGADDIHGDGGDDFLHGGVGDDTVYGDGGLDTLWGGDGDDTFSFDSTNAYTETDVIADFDSANDAIDISDLLSAYDPMSDVLSDFVEITDNGTDSTLSVDADGGADSFTAVANIIGVTGLTDEAALEASGALVTA